MKSRTAKAIPSAKQLVLKSASRLGLATALTLLVQSVLPPSYAVPSHKHTDVLLDPLRPGTSLSLLAQAAETSESKTNASKTKSAFMKSKKEGKADKGAKKSSTKDKKGKEEVSDKTDKETGKATKSSDKKKSIRAESDAKEELKGKKAKEKDSEKKAEEEASKKEKKAKAIDKEEKKAAKKEAEETARKANEKEKESEKRAEKKKKHGWFRRGKNEAESAEEKEAVEVETAKQSEKASVEKPAAPARTQAIKKGKEASGAAASVEKPLLEPDSALISVLQDMTKGLTDVNETNDIETADDKLIVGLSKQILDKALASKELKDNRILPAEFSNKAKNSMTAEAWASGDVQVSDKLRGSVAAVWGKRINGLLSVTIAGDCQDKTLFNGEKVGEFIVIVQGRSPVKSGFDIQSQSDVTYWIGTVSGVSIDAACSRLKEKSAENAGTEEGEKEGSEKPAAPEKSGENKDDSVKKKSTVVLDVVLTKRGREYLTALKKYEEQQQILLAQNQAEVVQADEEEELTAHESRGGRRGVDGSGRRAAQRARGEDYDTGDERRLGTPGEVRRARFVDNEVGEGLEGRRARVVDDEVGEGLEGRRARFVDDEVGEGLEGRRARFVDDEVGEGLEGRRNHPAESEMAGRQENGRSEFVRKPGRDESASKNNYNDQQTQAGEDRISLPRIAAIPGPASETSNRGWESPAIAATIRQPSLTANLLIPERAIAGKFLTVSVINKDRQPERSVELSFNGATLCTDQQGQVLYMIPEDATPGRTLNVSLAGRPELSPGILEILQPLDEVDDHKAPQIDKVSHLVAADSTLVVDGHDFDGLAGKDHIVIDGQYDASVIAASPVQLKVLLPKNINPGTHTVGINGMAMRSNPARFDLVKTAIDQPDLRKTKGTLNKLVVRVEGTKTPVPVRIVNRTPEVIKLSKGDNLLVTTPGGTDNSITLGVKQLKKGDYKVDAIIEM